MKRKTYPSLNNKTILITGANSGIGFEAAKIIASLNGNLIIAARNAARLEKAKEEILKMGPVQVEILIYDQSDPTSINNLINTLKERRLDAVIYNAGIYYPPLKGKEGAALTFKTNALGTYLLFEGMRNTHPHIRHIFVSSLARKKVQGSWEKALSKASRTKAYALSKEAIRLLYIKGLLEGEDAVLTHPGITKTNIIRGYAPWIRKLGQGFLYLFVHKPMKASLTMIEALSSESGAYLVPRGLFHISGYPKAIKNKRIRHGDPEPLINYLKGLIN